MIWAMLLLTGIFLIGAIFKVPELSREEIQIQREKMKAKREDLNEMDPRKFEFLVADLFQNLGYKAKVTPGSNDGGKDIILRKGRETKFVEVKGILKGQLEDQLFKNFIAPLWMLMLLEGISLH